ncbi:dipicolinate synthase subunit B [Oceanobacillus sp. CAU 1775]
MSLKNKKIGFGFTGSHHSQLFVFEELKKLVAEGADVYPIVSNTVQGIDTKHGKASDNILMIEKITGKKVISTIPEAEPFGPKNPLDCMVIAPLTGNSLSKLANAITDTPVLMAAKSTMRNSAPVVLGITTNDALGLNGVNLMKLLNTKNIFFIPFGQDNPLTKPNSLVANWNSLVKTVECSLNKTQIQPIIITY